MAIFRVGKPYIELERHTDFQAAPNIVTPVEWDTLIREDGDVSWNPTTPQYVTANRAGWYGASFNTQMNGNPAEVVGLLITIAVRTVSTKTVARTEDTPRLGPHRLSASAFAYVQEGDEIEARVSPRGGIGPNFTFPGSPAFRFTLLRLSPKQWT